MSETTTCPSCSATLPDGAAFCTTCGTRLSGAPEAPATPAADVTRVDNPGLHDSTQVFAPPPAPAAPISPWQPADSGAPPPPPPGPPVTPAGWAAPGAAPPPAPAPPPPASWPPAAPTASPPTSWGAPGVAPAPPTAWDAPPAPAWGEPVPPQRSGGGSPLGGIAALVGGLLVLVGLFTAWLGNNVTDETLTGWELLDGENGFDTNDPYLLLALGIVGLALAVALFRGLARTPVRIVAFVAGVAVVVTHARDWMDIADIAKALPQGVEINAQFGFYLGIVGGVLLAVSALLPAKK